MSGDEAQDKTFPCSVCFNSPMLKPIYQCSNGHVLCVSCEGRLKDCPTCKLRLCKLFKIRNLALEYLQPPLTKCEHKGCQDEFTTQEDMKAHSRYCRHRGKQELCKILGINQNCEQTFRLDEAEQAWWHMVAEHGDKLTLIPAGFWSSLSRRGTWVQGEDKFYGFFDSKVLFIMKYGTWGPGKTRGLLPLVFGWRYSPVRLRIKTWIGIKFEAKIKVKEFQRNPHVRRVNTVVPVIPAVQYNPLQSYSAIVEVGTSAESCFLQVSPEDDED